MSRAFTVHLKEIRGDERIFSCSYTFSNEKAADRFVESMTGLDIDYVGIIYGTWVKEVDSEGNIWSILYDQPTELDPEDFDLEEELEVDYV